MIFLLERKAGDPESTLDLIGSGQERHEFRTALFSLAFQATYDGVINNSDLDTLIGFSDGSRIFGDARSVLGTLFVKCETLQIDRVDFLRAKIQDSYESNEPLKADDATVMQLVEELRLLDKYFPVSLRSHYVGDLQRPHVLPLTAEGYGALINRAGEISPYVFELDERWGISDAVLDQLEPTHAVRQYPVIHRLPKYAYSENDTEARVLYDQPDVWMYGKMAGQTFTPLFAEIVDKWPATALTNSSSSTLR